MKTESNITLNLTIKSQENKKRMGEKKFYQKICITINKWQ